MMTTSSADIRPVDDHDADLKPAMVGCGHDSQHVVRICTASGWANICIACYRSNRAYYRSLSQGRLNSAVHRMVNAQLELNQALQ